MTAEPTLDSTARRRGATMRRTAIETRLAMPRRPKARRLDPDTRWQADAVCGRPGVPEIDRAKFVRIDRQVDAWPVVQEYCERCPVAQACLTDGRNVYGSGVYGGLVLEDGHLARDASTAEQSYRDPAVWTTPPPTLVAVNDDDTTDDDTTDDTTDDDTTDDATDDTTVNDDDATVTDDDATVTDDDATVTDDDATDDTTDDDDTTVTSAATIPDGEGGRQLMPGAVVGPSRPRGQRVQPRAAASRIAHLGVALPSCG